MIDIGETLKEINDMIDNHAKTHKTTQRDVIAWSWCRKHVKMTRHFLLNGKYICSLCDDNGTGKVPR